MIRTPRLRMRRSERLAGGRVTPRTCRVRLSVLIAMAMLAPPVATASAADPPHDAPTAARPNIVLFVSDDHRADMLGCAGHPFLQTPNIDRLAGRGVRYENAFVTTSICAASRASILTGLVERTHRFTFGTPPLAEAHCDRSYPRLLREAGYHTGFVGKFGVQVEGGRPTVDTLFDEFTPIGPPYLKALPDGTIRHESDLVGEAAAEFVRDAPADRPFCLAVSFNAAHAVDGDLENHYPHAASEAGLYEGFAMPRPRLDGNEAFAAEPPHLQDSMNRDRWHWRWDTEEKYDRNLRNYLRLLTGLDRNIGRVLEALEARGIADTTVVVFIGDNGYYMGERGFAGKWSHHEESLRVPLVVCDPRRPESARGMVDDSIALNIDVAPTLLAAAGLEPPDSMQGRALAAVEGVEASEPRADFFCEHRMRNPRIPRWEGIRSRDWKYARYLDVEGSPEHLYDLRADPLEQRDLAGDPESRPQLLAMREETARRSKALRDEGEPLPRVLLLGDSISMGYHDAVERALDGEAVVVRPRENCEGTLKGERRVESWIALDGGNFDLIHFNFGLHDLKRVEEDGKNSDDPSDARQSELPEYERRLEAICDVLEATGATLVFATTTPVPAGGVRPHRDPDDVERYNAAAKAIMARRGIAIDDLESFARPRLEQLQRPRDVHFTAAGSQALGEQVVTAIRAQLVAAAAKPKHPSRSFRSEPATRLRNGCVGGRLAQLSPSSRSVGLTSRAGRRTAGGAQIKQHADHDQHHAAARHATQLVHGDGVGDGGEWHEEKAQHRPQHALVRRPEVVGEQE